VAALILGLMPGLGGRGVISPAAALGAAPAAVTVRQVPKGPFIRINPAADEVAVNLPLWGCRERAREGLWLLVRWALTYDGWARDNALEVVAPERVEMVRAAMPAL